MALGIGGCNLGEMFVINNLSSRRGCAAYGAYRRRRANIFIIRRARHRVLMVAVTETPVVGVALISKHHHLR